MFAIASKNKNKRIKLMLGALLDEVLEDHPVSVTNKAILPLIIPTTSLNQNFAICTLWDDQHVRMPGFYEIWIDRYLETDFWDHFRMTRLTFEKLIMLTGPHFYSPSEDKGGRKAIPLVGEMSSDNLVVSDQRMHNVYSIW